MRIKVLYLNLIISLICSFLCDGQNTSIDSVQIIFDAKIKSFNYCNINFGSLSEIEKLVNETNAKFLSQKGFDNVFFIKVKVRQRSEIIRSIFMTNASPNEIWSFSHSDTVNFIDVDTIMDNFIFRTYGAYPYEKDNDFWESKLPPNHHYFKYRGSIFKDFYYAYSIAKSKLYLIKIDDEYQFLDDDFRAIVYSKSDLFFAGEAKSLFRDNDLDINPKKKLPKEIFNNITVDELKTDFLKLLPKYNKYYFDLDAFRDNKMTNSKMDINYLWHQKWRKSKNGNHIIKTTFKRVLSFSKRGAPSNDNCKYP